MKRHDFIKKGLGSLGGMVTALAFLNSCETDEVAIEEETTGITSDPTVTPSSCSVTNSETEGPFPTKSPGSYVTTNIVSDRTGTPLTIKIYIRNVNDSCKIIQGALVDIWHCDAAGNYSQYGGTQMQSANYSSVSFLRGRQSTDTNGMTGWTSIFPGWYSGRAPHIHVHVYNSSGNSLLVTQIAFPPEVCKVVYAQGVYASHGQADTTNERDNVFGDGYTNELATVTGSVSAGYELTHTIFVKG